MSEAERLDIIEVLDEEGGKHLLAVEKYFYYNGEEYVLLREVLDDAGTQPEGDAQLRVMRVEVTEDQDGEEVEDFVAVEDALEASLVQAARIHYTAPDAQPQGD